MDDWHCAIIAAADFDANDQPGAPRL